MQESPKLADDIRQAGIDSAPAERIQRVGNAVGCVAGGIMLLLVILWIYRPALDAPFIYDDQSAIVENASIRNLLPLWSPSSQTPLNPPKSSPFAARPLVNVTFAVNYHFAGLEPFTYRRVHLALQFACSVLLWGIIARTLRLPYFPNCLNSKAGLLSFAAAAIWTVHPVLTETVVYLTQRTELLMGLFVLLAFYLSQRYWDTQRRVPRVVLLISIAVASIAGITCKEITATLPAVVLLYERTFRTGSFSVALRRSWPLYLALSSCWVVAALLYAYGFRTPGGGFDVEMPAHRWWLLQAQAAALYLRLAIWPWPLIIHYDFPTGGDWLSAWPWVTLNVLLIAAGLILFFRRAAAGFVILSFYTLLSPTLLIPLPGEVAAERRLYLPLAAIVPFLVVGAFYLADRIGSHNASRRNLSGYLACGGFGLAVLGLATVFGLLGRHRLTAYQSELLLWQDTKRHQPHNATAWLNLGRQLELRGRAEEALTHFRKAFELEPRSYLASFNLARALENAGEAAKAIDAYRRATQLRPEDAASHYNLARLLESAGDGDQARRHYESALASEPQFAAAHTNLAILLFQLGDAEQAIERFESAYRLEPDLANCMNLAMALAQLGRTEEAFHCFTEARQLAQEEQDPDLVRQLDALLERF